MVNKDDLRCYLKTGSLIFPKVVQVEITNRCPFRCPQCYKKQLSVEDMPIDKLISVIEECSEQGTELFILNGGEPLIYPYIISIIKYLTERKIQFNCFSSGYGLTDEIIQYVKMGCMNLFISLNGSIEEVNKLSREGYSYAVDAIKRLDAQGAPFKINWVARHDNVYDFPAVVKLALENHARAVSVIGNKLINNSYVDSPMESEDYKYLADYINTFPFYDKIGITVEQCFPQLSALLPTLPKTPLSGCLAGVFSCNVTVDGQYMPCTQLHYKEEFGSVKEYWANSEILKGLRKIKKENLKYCQECQEKYCRICRAVSKECHDDFSVGYEMCPIRQ